MNADPSEFTSFPDPQVGLATSMCQRPASPLHVKAFRTMLSRPVAPPCLQDMLMSGDVVLPPGMDEATEMGIDITTSWGPALAPTPVPARASPAANIWTTASSDIGQTDLDRTMQAITDHLRPLHMHLDDGQVCSASAGSAGCPSMLTCCRSSTPALCQCPPAANSGMRLPATTCSAALFLLLQVELTAVQVRTAQALRNVADVYATHVELDICALREPRRTWPLSFEWGRAVQWGVAPLPPPPGWQQQQIQGAAPPAFMVVEESDVEPLPSPARSAGSAGFPSDTATPAATAATRAVTSECDADSPSCSAGST